MQTVAQTLALRKLLDEQVAQGVQDKAERMRITLQWAGALFKDSDVKIVDPAVKERVRAIAGQDDWKTFWPRMVSSDTELKSLLLQ